MESGRRRPSSVPTGLTVDSAGEAAVDPTVNVIALSAAANSRQDDLRNLTNELQEAKLAHIREVGDIRSDCLREVSDLREGYMEKLSAAESARLNSIRQIDREDVNKTAAAAQTAIAALATNTTALADTLRNQVASVANAAETRRSADNAEITKRLSALELASSEGKGKQTLADPRLDKLIEVVERLQSGSYRGQGADNQAAGSRAIVQWAVGLFVVIIVAVCGIVVSIVLNKG